MQFIGMEVNGGRIIVEGYIMVCFEREKVLQWKDLIEQCLSFFLDLDFGQVEE